MHAKLATAATSAVSTPGRRRISRSGAGSPSTPPLSKCSLRAIVRGSGRTSSTSTSPTTMIPAAAIHGTTSASVSSSLPGEERPEDERPERGAEEGAEEDVGDAPRAALGRIHVGGGGAREQDRPLRDADEREAGHDHRGGLDLAAERGRQAAGDARRRSRRRAPGSGRTGPSAALPAAPRALRQ